MSHGRKHKGGNLFARLCDVQQLEAAWLEVLGHYKKTAVPAALAEYDRRRGKNLQQLARELHARQYLPTPAALIAIPKPNKPGETREISLLPPADRIVLTQLNRLLTPVLEPRFPSRVYSYRRGRGAQDAIGRIAKVLGEGATHAATGDIDDFFPSIERERLLGELKRSVWEGGVIDLIETYLHIGAGARMEWVDSGRGIAQGSPLSPLLSNLYLQPVDEYLGGAGVEWVRYADNYALMGRAQGRLERAMGELGKRLEERGLRLDPASIHVGAEAQGFEYMGFRFAGGKRRMAEDRMAAKRAALAGVFGRGGRGLEELVMELGEMAAGWRNYYGKPGPGVETLEQLEELRGAMAGGLTEWLKGYRARPENGKARLDDLRRVLQGMEWPVRAEATERERWVAGILAGSRPEARPAAKLSEQARKAVEQRKREYQQRRDELQEILITKPGAYLGRTGERLLIRREGKREAEVPLSLIRNITLLTTACSFSGELVTEAANRGIGITMLGFDGKPQVQIGAMEAPQYQLTLGQARLAESAAGLELARKIVLGKMRNQMNLLRYRAKYRERRGEEGFRVEYEGAMAEFERQARQVEEMDLEVGVDLARGRLMAAEGQAAAAYWRAVRKLIWRKVGFDSRVHRGADDLMNVLLNYGYGILYGRVHGVLARTGLNVNIGFLHKPQAGKPGLVFDFIEEYRAPVVDRTVFALLNLGKGFALSDGRLGQDGRHALSRAVVERLQAGVRYRGETLPLQEVMGRQARRLADHVMGKGEYKAFVMPW